MFKGVRGLFSALSPTCPFQKRNDVLYFPQRKPLDPANYWHRIYTPSILSTRVSFVHNPYQFLPRTPQRHILLPVTSLTSCPREFLRPALLLGPEFLVVRLCVHLQLAEIRADDFFAAIRALFAISHILNPHPCPLSGHASCASAREATPFSPLTLLSQFFCFPFSFE